jgi:hypothetical protein
MSIRKLSMQPAGHRARVVLAAAACPPLRAPARLARQGE